MGKITLTQVRKSFGETHVIPGIDLNIEHGEFVVFVGPSGCGKSTLLRLIAGLEDISGGKIEIDGHDATDLPPGKRGLAMVFQSYALYPHMSVKKNIAFPLKMAGLDEAAIEAKVQSAAKILNLSNYLERKPGQLSGGQRQRVALARALVNEPRVLLLDEPLGALDLKLREAMQDELKALQQRLGITFVFVTHDQHEALSMADSLAVFNEGKIAQIGTPEAVYNRPATRFVADFVGSSNVLPPALTRALGGPEEWASLRPEVTRLAASGPVTGTVTALRYLGSGTRVVMDMGGTEVAALVPAGTALPEPGARTAIAFDATALHIMAGV